MSQAEYASAIAIGERPPVIRASDACTARSIIDGYAVSASESRSAENVPGRPGFGAGRAAAGAPAAGTGRFGVADGFASTASVFREGARARARDRGLFARDSRVITGMNCTFCLPSRGSIVRLAVRGRVDASHSRSGASRPIREPPVLHSPTL